jgi:small-conductance mechanosensitive channel
LVIIGVITSLYIIGFGNAANKFVAGAGISAIIIGFAFKDIGENFLAGIMLAFSRPFSIRDSVECAGMKGLVIKLTLRYTHIRSEDGRDIYMPNAMIVKNPLINYTRDGLIRLDFILDICDEENISDAQELITKSLISQDWILKEPAPSVVIESMADQHIQLKTMFWIDTFSTKKNADLVKSEVMHQSRNILRTNGFNLSGKKIN